MLLEELMDTSGHFSRLISSPCSLSTKEVFAAQASCLAAFRIAFLIVLLVVLSPHTMHPNAGRPREVHQVPHEGTGGILPAEWTGQRTCGVDARQDIPPPVIRRKRAPEQGDRLSAMSTLKDGVAPVVLGVGSLYLDFDHITPLFRTHISLPFSIA
jgi:hypothetical protein